MKMRSLCWLLIFVSGTISSFGQIITGFAGNGTVGYSGNGGPATSAQLNWPYCVVADNAGNVYVGDHSNDVIRKIDPTGIISVFAGNHVLGYSGDGGPATAAQIYHPGVMTVDNAGNFYFADQNSDILRKIDPAGIITTIAPNTIPGYSGDGGPLALAGFTSISGLACDNAGNLYISDFSHGVVRKVNSAGIITTIAGVGTQGFSGDGGPAVLAQLDHPYGVVIDATGNIYIPDNGNSRIRKIDLTGTISTFAGNGSIGYSGDGGPATAASFKYPWHSTIDNSGNLFVVDGGNDVIRRIDPSGIITTYAGNGTAGYSGDGGPAVLAQMIDACGITADNAGNVYVVNRTYPNVVRKITNCLTATVSQQPSSVTLCNTGNASFAVVAANATAFRWEVNDGNGWTMINDDGTYAGSIGNQLNIANAGAGMNGYQYRCALTNACGTIYSQTGVLTVTAPLTPTINIVTTSSDICAGEQVTFSALTTNGGTTPLFQWYINGNPVAATASNFTTSVLADGDQVSCRLTSSAACLSSPTVLSNTIPVTVTVPVTPSVTISPSAPVVCAGTPVSFAATAVNGGPGVAYTWIINGTNLLLNSPTYTLSAPGDGDDVMCVIQSSLACVTSRVVLSAPVQVQVNPLLTPALSISASASAVCKGQPVVFTATAVNGGGTPVYTWMKNGQPVGTNGNVYTENNPVSGDLVTCILTATGNCLTTNTASANSISLTVYTDPVVMLDQTNGICEGGSRTLDAGAFSAYQWNTGAASRTITVTAPGNYQVTVTDSRGCTGQGAADINTVWPAPAAFLPADTAVCQYGSIEVKTGNAYRAYLWSNGSVNAGLAVSQPGQYWLQVTDNNNCTGMDTIDISSKICQQGLFVPSAFTPDQDGRNDVFRPMLFGNVLHYRFIVYNRWGQSVFESRDPSRSWDGRYQGVLQNGAVFVWVCQYQLEGEEPKTEKGTVVLIR